MRGPALNQMAQGPPPFYFITKRARNAGAPRLGIARCRCGRYKVF